MSVEPDRTNWKQFCQVLPLTDAEYADWREMSRTIVKDDNLFAFVVERTEVEWKQSIAEAGKVECWSDMVKWADAYRRLQRAEIAAWKEWKIVRGVAQEVRL